MPINIAIIGFGTVGSALYRQLSQLPDYHVKHILVKDDTKRRLLSDYLTTTITTDTRRVLHDPAVAIVLEAIDDAEAAASYAEQVLTQGKVYISANKKMLASEVEALHRLAVRREGKLYYEAAVAGAIPVLRVVREHLSAEPLLRIRGVLNGSCNYILTRMEQGGLSYGQALREAQHKGFAESDPRLDVDGWDASYKAMLLAYEAFGYLPREQEVRRSGIAHLTREDVDQAAALGTKLKLVATISTRRGVPTVEVGVEAITPQDPLYGVDRELNAVQLSCKNAGELLLQGAGAGGAATASAMVGDLQSAKAWLTRETKTKGERATG